MSPPHHPSNETLTPHPVSSYSPCPHTDAALSPDTRVNSQRTYEETLAFNPGAFASDFSWMVYRPATRLVEASSLED